MTPNHQFRVSPNNRSSIAQTRAGSAAADAALVIAFAVRSDGAPKVRWMAFLSATRRNGIRVFLRSIASICRCARESFSALSGPPVAASLPCCT